MEPASPDSSNYYINYRGNNVWWGRATDVTEVVGDNMKSTLVYTVCRKSKEPKFLVLAFGKEPHFVDDLCPLLWPHF